MKKIIISILIILLICGCTKETKKEVVKEKKKEEPIVIEETYKDLNNTPIGIYKLNGNTLNKLTTIDKHLNVEEDIGIFQIYPSNEDVINLNTNFGESFYNEYIKYPNIKIGFNIKYTTNNEEVSYNIFSPDNTFDHWEYLMNYLYDDYANRYSSFYSHIESNQVNENTLYTSIKLQASYSCSEITNIRLTAFTYDSEDDFLNNEYRGNSKYTLNININ